MFESLEIFLLGFAAVVETALLLVLLERINRPLAPDWLRLLVSGAWLWHVCSLLHVLLRDVTGVTVLGLDQLLMAGMSLGLLLMPSGMLHAAVRLYFTGLEPRPSRDRRYLLLYVPLLAFPWVCVVISRAQSRDFMEAVAPLRDVYLAWLMTADTAAVLLFVIVRKRLAVAAKLFLNQLAVFLLLVTGLVVAYAGMAEESRSYPWLRLLTSVSPLIPALLFAWHAFRQQLIPLVLERTIIYGATLAAILLLHRLTVSSLAEAMQRTSNFDFIFMEGLLLIVVVLFWKRLRERVRESLRYLMSENVRETRDAIRHLSVELSQHAHLPVIQLAEWFQTSVAEAMGSLHCTVLLRDAVTGRYQPVAASRSVQPAPSFQLQPEEICQRLSDVCHQSPDSYLDRGDVVAADVAEMMAAADVMWMFPMQFRSVHGTVWLGPRLRRDRLGEEQLAALRMLSDQFAATLHNRRLDDARGVAERRAMQSEKLSVLGLLAGSIAHELRNPLSSMRTITSLAIEDLGQTHSCAGDLKMIVQEIDRLNQTAVRLLEFSRPVDEQSDRCQPDQVIQRLLHILSHLARQYHVEVTTTLQADDAWVAASEAVVSEIFFNLLKNAIEAVRGQANGAVEITSHIDADSVRYIVADNGPGVAPELLNTLCEPFVTGKADGTGLGLFIVSERIRESGGQLECRPGNGAGTQFVVSLPLHRLTHVSTPNVVVQT